MQTIRNKIDVGQLASEIDIKMRIFSRGLVYENALPVSE